MIVRSDSYIYLVVYLVYNFFLITLVRRRANLKFYSESDRVRDRMPQSVCSDLVQISSYDVCKPQPHSNSGREARGWLGSGSGTRRVRR